jgi:hypothetical protein
MKSAAEGKLPARVGRASRELPQWLLPQGWKHLPCCGYTSIMNQTTPNLIPLGIITMLAMVLLVAAVTRLMLARQRAARRVVEKPNSEYVWQRVKELEKADRWAAINLESLHEINRDEVRRLLARVEASGPDTLRPMERAFLDSLAGA